MHHWPHFNPSNIYVLEIILLNFLLTLNIEPRPPSPNLFLPLPSTLKSHHINYLYLLLVNFQRLVLVYKCILSLFKMSEREVFTQVTGCSPIMGLFKATKEISSNQLLLFQAQNDLYLIMKVPLESVILLNVDIPSPSQFYSSIYPIHCYKETGNELLTFN